MITQSEIKKLFHYDPLNGVFTNIKRKKQYNSVNSNGYIEINIYGTTYRAHRLAFIYMLGENPPQSVDHINGIRNDNRWCNLRMCSQKENSFNSKPMIGKISSYKGVSFHNPTNKWRAYAKLNKKNIHLGLFKTELEAFNAYDSFAKDNHGEYYRPQV